MTNFQLRPVDTWFFRDATPFTADSSPQEGVKSVFPPHPPTVVGALRAAIARCNGWSGHKRWPTRLNSVLGDGHCNLGKLSFVGPLVLQDGQPVYRCPHHLLGTRSDGVWHPSAFLRPGDPVQCDLGNAVRLPQVAGPLQGRTRLKTGRDVWVTASGLSRVLKGSRPLDGEVVRTEELWVEEGRIGLERNHDTRTAAEGMLYSTRHVRLKSGVSVGVSVVGIPDDWNPPHGMIPLGGEGRLAELTAWEDYVPLDTFGPDVENDGRMAVVALTPLHLERDELLGLRPLEGLGRTRVVSACLGPALRVGGWDSLSGRPRQLQSVLAPGSVLFCEAESGAGPSLVWDEPSGCLQLGAQQEMGYGLVSIGNWPAKQGGK